MDTAVSLVVDLEDVSEREEGEIIEGSDDENGLENVSSSEDETVICDHSQVQAKRRKIVLNFRRQHKPDTVQVHQKSRKRESLSDISDLEPESAICKKYISISARDQDSFSNFTKRTRKIYDPEKLKNIHRTVQRKDYAKPHRPSENHSSRDVSQRRNRRKRSKSKTKEKHKGDISSSDTESREDLIRRRKLKEALSIDSTNKTDLKNRLMSMLGKSKEKADDQIETLKAPSDVNVVDGLSSEDDIDLLRLRLLALKSKNLENCPNEIEDSSINSNNTVPSMEEGVQTVVNGLPNDTNSKDNSSIKNGEGESEEVLQLRIQALKSAVIRKHLARKHKNKDDMQAAMNSMGSKEGTVVDSCATLSTENDIANDRILDTATDVPYSPTQSLSDAITSEEMSDFVDSISVPDSQLEKPDEVVNVSSEALENVKSSINVVVNSEMPHMDSGQGAETCQTIEPCTSIPENSKTVINMQNSAIRRKVLRTKSFTKHADKTNLNTITTNKIQQNVIEVNNEVDDENSTESSSRTKSLASPTEEDEGILREMLLANINKNKVIEGTDSKPLDDEDEDILRAMLLSKLSNKVAATQVHAVKNKENKNTMINNDSKTYRTPRSKILKGHVQKRNQSRSPMKLVKKTVTNTKVINKRIAKPVLKPKENESNSKPKIPTIVVPKLIINLGADSDTDEENPFKCKSPDKIEIQNTKVKPTGPIENVILPEQIQDNTNTSQPSSIKVNTDFEKSLDVFLKTARSKVECTVPQKSVARKVITPPKPIVTPKIARHMSLSQQKEYKQLLQKMLVLEKRKAANLKKPPICVKSPISAPKNSSKKSTALAVRSKEKFANNLTIEIKSNLQDETRKIIAVDKNSNTSKELKNVSINDNCINITIANNLTVQSLSNKDTARSNSKVVSVDKTISKQLKGITKSEPQKSAPVQIEKSTDASKDEKMKELQKNEKFLIQKRMDFIAEVDDLLKMVTKTEAEKANQTAMEKEVSELRERLKYAECKLEIQSKLTGKLFENVAHSKKRLELRKRQCIDMNYKCMRLGSQISSTYRSPMDGSELMKEKVQQLTLKTVKLSKDIPSTKVDEQIKLATTITNSRITPAFSEDVRKEVKSKNNITEVKSVVEEKIEVVQIEKVVSNESEFIPLSSAEGFNKIPGLISEGGRTEFKVAIYESPLANMENQSASDPNAVLCPYELMGRCEDSHCTFIHLSVTSDLKVL